MNSVFGIITSIGGGGGGNGNGGGGLGGGSGGGGGGYDGLYAPKPQNPLYLSYYF